MVGSLALHGVLIAAVLGDLSPRAGSIDEAAAITVFVDPAAAPVATATESAPAPVPEAESVPEPEVAAAPAPETQPPPEPQPPEPSLADAVPAPPELESLATPDFTKPPPRPEPRKAPQKVEPRHPPAAAPAPARRATPPPAPAPAPGPSGSTASAPPAAAPNAAVNAAPGVAPGWNALLAAWLAAHRRYPDEARRRSEQGDVTVRFTVHGSGQVTDVSLVQSSGSTSLDASALAMLGGAMLPPPGVEATRTVRIRFRLSD